MRLEVLDRIEKLQEEVADMSIILKEEKLMKETSDKDVIALREKIKELEQQIVKIIEM